jgi:hypothetical protein
MSTLPPQSPQFELRNSSSTIGTFAEPRYMSVAYCCQRYHAAISEIEIVGINGSKFVDLDSTNAKMLILKAKFS